MIHVHALGLVEGAKEIEYDGVAQHGRILNYAISEHVENAGVHSGDATLMLPPQTLSAADIAEVETTTHKLAEALKITGPFNMQLIAKQACRYRAVLPRGREGLLHRRAASSRRMPSQKPARDDRRCDEMQRAPSGRARSR